MANENVKTPRTSPPSLWVSLATRSSSEIAGGRANAAAYTAPTPIHTRVASDVGVRLMTRESTGRFFAAFTGSGCTNGSRRRGGLRWQTTPTPLTFGPNPALGIDHAVPLSEVRAGDVAATGTADRVSTASRSGNTSVRAR
jgi:hypothetical protein